MTEYLQLKKANCKNCYRCIRHCPVKAISFSSDQANILQEECILCGQCFVTCPQNAKSIRSDVGAARELIASGAPVWASVAPSFVANYPGATMGSVRAALLRLGFSGAEETAVGAAMVTRRYQELVREKNQRVILSSCCHSVNMMIQKYYPGALPYLAKVMSPMQAHCLSLKKQDPGVKTVFIGPCISKKAEAEQYPGTADCVLTFEELSGWLAEEGVAIESGGDWEPGGRTRLYPTRGGILRSMAKEGADYSYIAIDGVDNCIRALGDVVDGSITDCFIEMSACSGSCIGGPAMDKSHHFPIRDYMTVNQCAGKEHFVVEMPPAGAMDKAIGFLSNNRKKPGSAAIQEVLRKMGKTLPEHELNCGSCGYDTCREKAVAILQGKADMSMCLPYLKERAESFSDNIIYNTPNGIMVLNEFLEVQQLNGAACRIMNIQNERDVLGRQVVCVLDPSPFLEVNQKGRNIYDRRVYLAEYRRYVMMTVVRDQSYHIIICIMRDVTGDEDSRSRKEETNRKTMEIADRVIEKQMRTVQEIASLLGETAAETKVALTKLKETLRDE